MPRFPHLNDNEFPFIRTVDVYDFKNEFDYTRWNTDTDLLLCNVAWDSAYEDVVKFDNDNARDNYFDNIDTAYKLTLKTAARVVPEGFVKLPIPYDVVTRYNYLCVTLPIATSSTTPIDYENSSGKRRWYFFIDRCVYLAPSTTQLYLTLDVWTNFANDLDIKYMLLERGHAPVYASNTDTYLENPMVNNRYLLAPDVSFDEAGINASVTDVPFGYGKKFVCIASTCAPWQVSSLGTVSQSAEYADFVGPITYADTADRYGYQLEVSGFTVGNGYDYSNARTPVAVGASENAMLANNLTVYCIQAEEVYGPSNTFFEDVRRTCPQFLNTVRGCFVVSEECLVFGTPYQIAGHTMYLAIGSRQPNILTKPLTKQDFNYPQEYERFAKLYTSPYAVLEFTNNDGKTVTVNVEETSTLKVAAMTSIAFPYVESLLFVTGIRGNGSAQYTWRDLHNNELTSTFDHSDWFDFCFKMEIPTFALYMDGETAYALHNFNRSIKQGINDALLAYRNHVRSSNTAMENARDSADAAEQNTKDSALAGKTASYNSADTGKANADASATTAKANANASAATAKQNSYNDADTAKQNADNNANATKTNSDAMALVNQTNAKNSAAAQKTVTDATADLNSDNTTLQLTLKAAIVALENEASTDITENSVTYATQDTYNANQAQFAVTTDQADVATQTQYNNNIDKIVSGALSGAATNAALGTALGGWVGTYVAPGLGSALGAAGGGVGGAVIGAVGGGISAMMSTANTTLSIGHSVVARNSTVSLNNSTTTNSNAKAGYGTQRSNRLKTETTTAETTSADTARQNTLNLSKSNATLAKTTSDTNADNAYNATITANTTSYNAATTNAANTQTSRKTNADNSKALADNNADRTETTSKANATRTQTTTKANADLSYNAAIGNAARTRETIYNNSGYTREVEIINAKDTLENAANSRSASIRDARNAAPLMFGSYTGYCGPDNFGYKGLQIKVKTQSVSAIRQAGDIFARYGYTLNQVWNVRDSGLKLMRHFTYWKVGEIWLSVNVQGGDMVRDVFKRIFENGVTVWNSPTEIGEISVYDN